MSSEKTSSPAMTQALRLPGRIYADLIPLAEAHAADGDPDQDVAEAMSRPIIKPRGRGWTVFIRLGLDGVLRLADWIKDDECGVELCRYRDAMREQVAKMREGPL